MAYQIIPLSVSMPFGEMEQTIHPTLLWDENACVLVDCGFIGSLPLIEEQLKQFGLSSMQLTGLVLTHHDHDHMGAAAALKRQNPAITIYALAAEAPFISAQVKPLRLQQAEDMQRSLPPEQQAFGNAFCEMLRRVEPVPVDVLLKDGDWFGWCGGCRVVATPGHTPGHLSLFLEEASVVITGDAIALEEGVPVIANPQFTLNLDQAKQSMQKLLSLHAATYYCYHGGIWTERQNAEQ